MKKILAEFALYFLVAFLYFSWREREKVRRTFEQLNDEYADHVRSERAIEASLRSIRRLPETRDA